MPLKFSMLYFCKQMCRVRPDVVDGKPIVEISLVPVLVPGMGSRVVGESTGP